MGSLVVVQGTNLDLGGGWVMNTVVERGFDDGAVVGK